MQAKQFDAIDTVPTVPLRPGTRRSMRISYRDTRSLRAHRRLQQVSDAQEDAWLNDVGPGSQSVRARFALLGSDQNANGEAINHAPTDSMVRGMEPFCGSVVPDESDSSDSSDSSDGCSFSICSSNDCAHVEYIGCDHRLWPVVLHLSRHIWQEVYQKEGMAPTRERAKIEHVRKRSIELLRADLQLASQIEDRDEAEQVLGRVVDEVLGYGPIEGLLKDEDVSEIMVIGPQLTYIERNGKLEEMPNHFEDDQHVLRIIENMLRQAGQHIEAKRPIADVCLPDGSLVNIALPPSAVKGPTITIRKYTKKPLDMVDLVSLGSMSQEMANFLSACVQARLNIVICGGKSSGRTTLLGALGSCIAAEERIITIEDVAELQLSQRHVVALQARAMEPVNSRCNEQLAMHDLVSHALHMRPERIIVDGCRGSETVEMLQAMYAGYDGSLITMYAQNVRDCLARLEMMWLADGKKLPVPMIRAQIASSMDMIVHLLRLSDGSRKIMNIAEVQGVEGDRIKLQSIFHYHNAEINGEVGKKGAFRPSGFRPTFMSKLEARNIHLPDELFVPCRIS